MLVLVLVLVLEYQYVEPKIVHRNSNPPGPPTKQICRNNISASQDEDTPYFPSVKDQQKEVPNNTLGSDFWEWRQQRFKFSHVKTSNVKTSLQMEHKERIDLGAKILSTYNGLGNIV